MKKEKISNNENNKKISKNNKIISSILAITMCCQSLVGAVKPDGQPVDIKEMDSKKTVEIMEGKDKNEDESKKNDAVDKSEGFSSLAETIFGVGVSGAIILGLYYIYNAIKSKVEPGDEPPEVELDAEPSEVKLLNNEPKVIEPKTGTGKVEIGGESYETHNIGEKNGNDIGFKNLVVETGDGDLGVSLGIPEFVNEVTQDESEILSQVRVKSDYENKIDGLSDYSKFIVAITEGEESFSNYLKNNSIINPTIGDVVKHACKLLADQKDPEFCLINACVRLVFNYRYVHFLISEELAPYLEKKPPVQLL
ncbi:MAG: hypothetical protein CfP315_0943 [Candidatus Improbicoccus pseudotrichonymphae]|uniref:Uncharacterized protein n=1 Tax=Candidatus Improbicoccus pseudotrichonymphae TaxID=3033792 RepID=A0AA48I913_9FIRM|nr:MAG: hypothetical protein CfP315_0943 [Candidatus Improbicoccus pseudotrichonymphae]